MIGFPCGACGAFIYPDPTGRSRNVSDGKLHTCSQTVNPTPQRKAVEDNNAKKETSK